MKDLFGHIGYLNHLTAIWWPWNKTQLLIKENTNQKKQNLH